MVKMWWQDQRKQVKPWVIDRRRDPCDCSQGAKLRQTGYSEHQGPTHYCPVCRWAFWPIVMKPTAAQVDQEKRSNPNATYESMTYIKLYNRPGKNWTNAVKNKMTDQMVKLMPSFLTESMKEHFIKLYCKRYPNSKIASERKRREEEKEDQQY